MFDELSPECHIKAKQHRTVIAKGKQCRQKINACRYFHLKLLANGRLSKHSPARDVKHNNVKLIWFLYFKLHFYINI